MRRPGVLLASPMSRPLLAELAARYEVVQHTGSFADAGANLPDETRARIDAIVALGTEGIDARALSRFPSVRIIVCLGTGYDGIDLNAVADKGVAVAHSPGANAASVADVAIALVIECVRDIPRLRRHIHAGEWNGLRGARPEGRPGVTGRNLGIYGLGSIGRKIALRALACEMNVGYHGRRRHEAVSYPYFASLRELAQWSSVLVVAARADATNRHIVNGDVLQALGADGYLVNIARGSLIDEAALIAALRDGTIAGAGLDVYDNEPNPPQALLDLPNVALTPHVGGVTVESRARMEATVLANLAAHFAGEPVPFPVRA